MAKRVIQVGTGGFGRVWCEHFLPPNVADGHIEVVAAVDQNPEALKNASTYLGLSPKQCFSSVAECFTNVEADFCTIVVPPALHESIVDEALKFKLNILSEKPIADTLAGSLRIAEKVRRAGVKMGVTMSHRFDQDKSTMREKLQSGSCGELDYLMCRFTCSLREFGSWGEFRHRIPDTLLVEGGVHHLDIIADFALAKCETIYAQTWTPSWGEYDGDCQALINMKFENGVRAVYEGAKTNAVSLNGWGNEYFRAECKESTLILSQRQLEEFHYVPNAGYGQKKEGEGVQIPLANQQKWANTWLIEKFVNWLEGGEPMETNLEDNLQSVALVFAAIESKNTGQPVRVQEFLASERAKIRI